MYYQISYLYNSQITLHWEWREVMFVYMYNAIVIISKI